jgi:GDPmannose 4,6-dehydratase
VTINYRESYGIFACNGILFNHESERRGETFVTRKITRGLARIYCGLEDCLYLGNLDAQRDWGHARDYVEMQWLMLQQEQPRDFVIASGSQISVREFLEKAAQSLGITIGWRGVAESEVGFIKSISAKLGETNLSEGSVVVRVDPRYYRPAEVHTLLGDASLAHRELGWRPLVSIDQLVSEMMQADLRDAEKVRLLRLSGYH